jgi:multiple sugar transport system substrate-binding protein
MGESHNAHLDRRTVLGGAAALAGGLAGCMGGGSSGGGGNSIEYWSIHNSEDRRSVIEPTIESFEEDAGVDVETNFVDNNDIGTQLQSAISSDSLPDAALLAVQDIQRLGNDGAVSTESATAVVEELGEDDFRDATLNFVSNPDGGYYAVPSTSWVQGVWYRQSAFEEEGLDDPLTWDAILEAAEAFHDPDNGTYGIGFGTQQDAYARQCFTQMARANGGLVVNADGEVVFDEPEIVETLEYVQDLSQYTPGAITFDDTRQLYENEEIHMTLWSTNILRHILNNVGEEMAQDTGFASYMENSRQSTYGQVLGHPIFNSSDAKRESAEGLVEHVTSGEAYISWAHAAPGGMVPARQSVTETQEYQNNEILSAWGDTISQFTSAMDNMERFDLVDGTQVPEFGDIASAALVEGAVNRVAVQGDDPETVAQEQAEAMRDEV